MEDAKTLAVTVINLTSEVKDGVDHIKMSQINSENKSFEFIKESEIKELVLTDSIQASEEVKNTKNIRHISIAPLMGEAIKRINSDSSVSALFD